MEPTLDGAISALFGSPGVQQVQTLARVPNTELEQARAQLTEVQKAIDSLKRVLNETAESKPTNVAPHK